MAERRRLTGNEAATAVYVDFEGTAVDPPSLLGVLVEDRLTQFVIEEALWPAAVATAERHAAWTTLVACTFDEALAEVRAAAEGRRLFAWSSREQAAIEEHATDDALIEWCEAHLENAIPIARRWKRRTHPDVVFPRTRWGGRHALANYLPLVGYAVPRAFGPGNTAKRIRDVRAGLARCGGDYEPLTPTQKGKWTRLLQHNRHDLEGMRAVMRAVAGEG